MIIKTRLATDSPYHRFTDVDQGTDLSIILSELVEQWGLPKTVSYSLLSPNHLILDKSQEWISYSKVHSDRELHEFVIVTSDYLREALFPLKIATNTAEAKAADTTFSESPAGQTSTQNQSTPGFLSVEPRSSGLKQTYAQRLAEESKAKAIKEYPRSATMIETEPTPETAQQGLEEMSAYDRVMAKSRMQGEGLNKLFGTIMAKRAGHAEDFPETTVEVNTSVPVLDVEQATTSRVLKPQVAERNAWIENAWEQRLREMGHGSKRENPYAEQSNSKGKERDPVQEASSVQSSPLVERSISEEGEERIPRLHPLPDQASILLTPASELSPNLSFSVPSSRPGSASGLSFSGRSSKLSFARLLGKGNRKRQGSSFPFASQPPSLYSSGTLTPDESNTDINDVRRRRKAFSLRSLSDAFKDKKSNQGRSREASVHSQQIESRSINEQMAGEATINEESRSQSGGGEVEEERKSIAVPPKKQEEISRPTLLRASHSVPLSSTVVNLSSVDGITLHISTVGATPFARQEEEPVKRDLFDLMLPREIRISCFRWLVKIHEEEEIDDKTKQQRTGTSQAAAKELLRLTRVSKAWQSILLDGQLWSSIDSFFLSNISNASLLRLTRAAGPFIKQLDLRHASHISSSLFISMMSVPEDAKRLEAQRFKSMMSVPTLSSVKTVQLASLSKLNISGCRSISRTAFHGALVRLPSLSDLDISNSDVICEESCLILGASHPNLSSLNVSRCFNLSGKGIIAFIQAAQGALYDKALFSSSSHELQRESDITLSLQTLRIAGCLGIDSKVMSLIGSSLQSLQVLDLSYISTLDDAAMEAFVAHPGPIQHCASGEVRSVNHHIIESDCSQSVSPFITLTPRQAGGDIQRDEVHYRRLIPSLRHICLSSCRRLTDRSCTYLAHALPNLQYLEMANIGVNLREEGIVKLLETASQIQRVDLEGASEVSDGVLNALTPDASYLEALGMEMSKRGRRLSRRRFPQDRNEACSISQRISLKRRKPSPPGAHLTHLILSHVTKPSQDSLLQLIRRCPRLTHLQLDDTKANDAVLKEFVAICRKRESRNAYLSLVDCRALSRTANADVLSQSSIRPREGKRGREYRCLDYHDGAVASTRASGGDHHTVPIDECNDRLIVVKTFFNWEIRSQQRRLQQRRNHKALMIANGANGGRFLNRGRRDSLGAALAFIGGVSSNPGDEENGTGRWSRIAGGLMGQGDEAEDSRACTIM